MQAVQEEQKYEYSELHGFLKFKGAELRKLPQSFREVFRESGNCAHLIRRVSGLNREYEASFKRDGYDITETAENIEVLKFKFIRATQTAERAEEVNYIADLARVRRNMDEDLEEYARELNTTPAALMTDYERLAEAAASIDVIDLRLIWLLRFFGRSKKSLIWHLFRYLRDCYNKVLPVEVELVKEIARGEVKSERLSITAVSAVVPAPITTAEREQKGVA